MTAEVGASGLRPVTRMTGPLMAAEAEVEAEAEAEAEVEAELEQPEER